MFTDMQHATQSSLSLPTPARAICTGSMLSLMRYKSWADDDLLKAVSLQPELLGAPEGVYVMAILRHFHTVDSIFRAHLLGVPHPYTSPNPPEPASLA